MYRPFIPHQQLCKCLSSFLLHSQPQSPTSDQAKRGACSRRKTWQQRSHFCQRNPSEADTTISSQAWPTHVSLQQTASTSLLCATGLKLTFKLLSCVIHSDKTCSTILMLKKKKKIAALVVSETWNLLVSCCPSLCLGAWDRRQRWAIHPAVWMDVADLFKAVLQQGKSTQKLDSPGKSGGHRSPPEQSARNNFFLTAQIHLLPISPVNFVNPFSRYAGSTCNYLRGRGGIKRFHLAQSPSGGGATKQPGRLVPAQAQQRISPAVQGMTPFSPKQPVPCAGSSCARRAEQLCNRSLWGYAISVLRDFQDQLELQPTWFNVGNNAALSFSSFDLSNFFYLNP